MTHRITLLLEYTKVSEKWNKPTVMKIYASQNQLGQIKDFMKAIGVQFEVQQDV